MVQIKFLVQIFCLSVVASFMLLSSKVASAQQTKQKTKFSTVNEAGLLTGQKAGSLMLQSIYGLKKDKSFAGAGLGLDFYGYRTVPLFIDYRTELSSNKNTPFVYADAGINFLWLNSIQKEQLLSPSASPGFYYDLGIGWKLSGKNNRGFIVSAGYTFKQVKYKVSSYAIAPTPQLQSENDDRYNFLYKRLVIKIGFQL